MKFQSIGQFIKLIRTIVCRVAACFFSIEVSQRLPSADAWRRRALRRSTNFTSVSARFGV
jgi:hypothetical protein